LIRYENWPLWAVTEDTHVVQALLHLRGPEAARRRLEATQRMLATGIEEKMLSIYSDGIARKNLLSSRRLLIDDAAINLSLELFAFFAGPVHAILIVAPVDEFMENCDSHQVDAPGASVT
jgi:hypothetical protein